MSDDHYGSPPPPIGGQRGPLGGDAGMWKWIAIALVVLAALLIGPSLGTGPSRTPINDPDDRGPTPAPNEQPVDREITNV
ncbi:MAG: hypothetical protein CVT64_01745 [Actinobacteria bacterium HGW-Actinobacteria-4]|nr:MAG: hypothetical protein CVT64_01745 [Actinobacteria bacterium HGW-Actinobacteria-4]